MTEKNRTVNLAARATALAEQTADSFAWDRYRNWRGCALALLRAGYTEREAEAILRSKWSRLAADRAESESGKRYGHATGTDLVAFVRTQTYPTLSDLVLGTFGAEA